MYRFLLFICIACFVSSCTPRINYVVMSQRTQANKTKQSSELYKPIYQPNGGDKKTTIFNQGKAQKEREFMALLKSIPTPVSNPYRNSTDATDMAVSKAIENFNQKIYDLEEKLSRINPNKRGSEEEYHNLLIELNNLLCQERDGIVLLEKKVKKLYGDVSFQTGKFEITTKGASTLKDICKNIAHEVEKWRKYVNSCNQKLFENDLFVLVINIEGYADERGDEKTNLTLSRNRANAVEKFLRNELIRMVKEEKINIVFDKMYSDGYGEKLPPGVTRGPKDDPNRRICLINYIVGPARYLGK
jgi:outer membrane protein OmpA-like peptidoglycan-associated protein